MLSVSSGKCVVSVLSCVVVVRCTFKFVFALNSGGAGVVEPRVGAFLESNGTLWYVVLCSGEYVVGELGGVRVRIVSEKVSPVCCSESVVEGVPVSVFEVEYVTCEGSFCRCRKVER